MTNNNIAPDPITMDGLVERIADAIDLARYVRANPDRPDSDREYALKLANAAIEAAGIPTLLATIERQRDLMESEWLKVRTRFNDLHNEGAISYDILKAVVNAVSKYRDDVVEALESQP